ncbi:hypothetical protein T492DRAFT_1140257 [Pavlovales sp. CCMP2436]|nr:hypothetical protein T492DRAFT_1140257 [Pavlovales sp. CCMP2436]
MRATLLLCLGAALAIAEPPASLWCSRRAFACVGTTAAVLSGGLALNGVERGDEVVFVHEYARGKDADGIGREFCRDVQGLRREVRGLLFGGNYTEYDIVNCQPTIMLIWGARSYGLALPSLRNYYFNRDSMINVLGESTVWRRADTDIKASAKELVMRLSFGGAINTFETDNDCSLAGQGKVFAEGVKRDMDELKGCFRNDTPLYEYYNSRCTPCAKPQ